MVRIRDDDMKVMPGVRVEDMGHKMGLNGVDNAKLFFDNVRVPRENLLNRLLEPFYFRSGHFTEKNYVRRDKKGEISNIHTLAYHFSFSVINLGKNRE